jgi:hypothetical protein
VPDSQFAQSSLAQWAGAIATFLAVLVALFKDSIVRHFRRPRLGVRIDSEPPDCMLSPMTVWENNVAVWSGDSYWLRLWIENTGTVRAEQVQVFVAKLLKRDARGDFATVTNFSPMNLRWSNARDWKDPEIFAPGISHHMGKHCDLCSISDPTNPRDTLPGYEGQCVASLTLEVYPSGNRHRLPPGDYILELMVGAANADPVTTYVELNLKGAWSTNQAVMFRDHVGVKVVTNPVKG